MTRKKLSLSALLTPVALAIALAGCGSGGAASAAGPGGGASSAKPGFQTIRYQTIPGNFDLLEFASYLGYLPGIPIKHVGTVLGGPADIQAVATGSSDIGGAFNGAIVAAIAAGAKLKAVIGYYGTDAKTYGGIYVRADSSIHSAKDLIGKTVGVNTLGANATEVADLWLAKQGLTTDEIKKVQFVVVSPTEAGEALATGRIDSAFLQFATLKLAVKKSKLRPLMTDYQFIGPYTAGSLVLRPSFIQQRPAETKELVKGIAQAVHWLQVTPRAQIVKIGEKVSALHGRSSDNSWITSWTSQGVAEPYGYIKPVNFSRWFGPMEVSGQLKNGQVSVGQLYTNQFNPYTPH